MSFFGGSTELPQDQPPLPEDEMAVLDKLARKVVEWQMTAPAIIFLESVKPLNFIGSQAMVFFEPIVQSIFAFKDYETIRSALEKRQSIEVLLQKIEEQDVEASARDKRIKKYRKEQKKSWKWYQRYLGVFQPRIQYPDWVIHGEQGEKKPGEDKGKGDGEKGSSGS